jgi:membrane protease YdiL (CAAX protease family)
MCGVREIGFRSSVCIWAAFTFAAATYGLYLGYHGVAFTTTLAVFAFFLAAEMLVASRAMHFRIVGFLESHSPLSVALILPLFPILAYLIYLEGTNTFRWWRLGLAMAYVLAPEVLIISSRRAATPGLWRDYAAILVLWLPVVCRWLHPLWPYPNQELSYVLTVLLAMNVGIVSFLILRRVDGVGYIFAWGPGWGTWVGISFALMCAVEIPLAHVLRFAHFHPDAAALKHLPVEVPGIFLFIAWPEEFIFRGLLQNLLSRSLGSSSRGWIISSIIFGLAHLGLRGFPNWSYVLLATIAGLVYGRAWLQTRSIFAPALIHTLVDATWQALFYSP